MEGVVLVVSPHPDDAEIGMGGTICALREKHHKVILIDLTDGEPTPFGSVEKRKQESIEAASILGVEREQLDIKNREVFDTVENRKIQRQNSKGEMEEVNVPYATLNTKTQATFTKLAEIVLKFYKQEAYKKENFQSFYQNGHYNN